MVNHKIFKMNSSHPLKKIQPDPACYLERNLAPSDSRVIDRDALHRDIVFTLKEWTISSLSLFSLACPTTPPFCLKPQMMRLTAVLNGEAMDFEILKSVLKGKPTLLNGFPADFEILKSVLNGKPVMLNGSSKSLNACPKDPEILMSLLNSRARLLNGEAAMSHGRPETTVTPPRPSHAKKNETNPC